MDYGNLLSRAWRISWRHKFLFALGFLAALGSSGSSAGQRFNYSFSGDELPPSVLQNADQLLALAGPLLAVLACVGLVVGIAMWLIRLVAQAGLISSAARLDRGETSSFGQAFSAGTSYLPRIAGLNILIYLPFWLIGAVTTAIGVFAFGAAIVSAVGGQGGPELDTLGAGFALIAICVLALFCLLAPLLAVATVVYAFAQRGIVLQDMGVTQSIGYSWRFIRNNVGDVLLLVLIIIVLSVLFGIGVGLVLLPLSFLAFGPTFLELLSGGQLQTMDAVFAVGGAIALGLISALLNSVFIAYRSVTVTLAYQDLLAKKV